MTVCIAAVCDLKPGQGKIVLCTDWQASAAIGKAETKFKQRFIAHDWKCLTAGYEADIHAVVRCLRDGYSNIDEIDETNVVQVTREALNKRKKQKIEEFIQGRYAVSYDEFLSNGKDKFPQEIFREAIFSLSQINIGADLVLAGFAGGFPMLLETDSRCGVSIKEDFATAGEGALLAASVLLHRQHSDLHSLSRALYSVFEAKKYAERVSSVGSKTAIGVLDRDGTFKMIGPKGRTALEKHFRDFGPKEIPEDFSIDVDYMEA